MPGMSETGVYESLGLDMAATATSTHTSSGAPRGSIGTAHSRTEEVANFFNL